MIKRQGLLGLAVLTVLAASAPAQAPGFRSVDLVIDSGDNALAAWQVELTYDRDRVGIVGIEAAAPDTHPPTYDSEALRSGRMKLADFSLAKQGFGRGEILVARLHLVGEDADIAPAIQVAARPGGERIEAKVFVRPAPIAVASPAPAALANRRAVKRAAAETAADAAPAAPAAEVVDPLGKPAEIAPPALPAAPPPGDRK